MTVVAIGGLLPLSTASATPAPTAPADTSTALAAADDPTGDGSVSDEDAALQQAQSTGAPAEVVPARTELSDEWANPDGTFSVKRYGSPVRLFRNGAWIPTDPTLAFAADGTVAPKASTVPVTFSGGGTGPLLSGVKDGRTLTLSWPTALPTPTLEGNVATYAEILPGVDLQLKAEVEGFSQLIVVKTAQAAQNPALATLRYTMSTVGLSVATDADTGSVTATDPAGQTVFTSPTPLMWDSTTTSSSDSTETAKSTGSSRAATAETTDTGTEDDAFEQPPGAQHAQMPTTVSGSTLSITPDQDLLTGADTQYPVYIDPSWAWGVRQNWTRVYKKYPNTSYWNANEVARVGYEAETNGLSRSFFQWDISNIEHAAVISSVFRIKNVWSWSPQKTPVDLWQTGPITSKTTWNHQPAQIGSSRLARVIDAKGWNTDPAGNLEFDLTPKIKDAASHANSSITLGLYAGDETDTYGWKKFDPKTAVLETTFNHTPSAPTGLGTNPKTSCTAGGLIGNTTVSLYATVKDQDAGNLTARFQVFPSGSTTAVVNKTIPALKDRVATLVVPDASLPTGSYTWKVNTTDPMNATSDWSATCKFSVDRTRPAKPPLINSTVFPNGEAGWPATTGTARTPADFTIAANGVADADAYGWYTDYQPQVNYVHVAAGGTATIPVTPPGYGPHFVYAFSIDAAGNRSDTATYIYYAASLGIRDVPGDLNGDGNNDIWNVDSNGTLLTYAGQGNGQFSAATNGGQAFDAAQVTSRGDWGQDGYNDLVALEPAATGTAKDLWEYPNNGSGIATGSGVDGGRQELTVACPAVTEPTDDNPDGCTTGDDHWHDADQIIAPGDINSDGAPDLLVKEDNLLWAYYGDRATKRLDIHGNPVLVGESDWSSYTVIAPGDLNGDGLPDLLLRDTASGDLFRTLGQAGEQAGLVDLARWGGAAQRTKVGSGLTPAYAELGANDFDGDGVPDLWARKTDNTMVGWFGKATNGSLTSYTSQFSIDGVVGGARIPAGTSLTPGASFTSRSVKLTMQSDGNLVITNNSGAQVWATGTSGNPGATAVMQPDGNFVLYKADGSTALWASNTQGAGGYALLQDRGNLIVYNVKSQSLWSSGSVTRHDYTGDGRSDVADWYNFADGHDGMHTFPALSDGTLTNPVASYVSAADVWYGPHMKLTTGDYNGDGLGDAAFLYGFQDGSVKLYTALNNGSGGFKAPTASWSVPSGQWYFEHVSVQSGDFNGDGRDDIAAWYNFADGSDGLFTFTANVQGGFNAPFESWTAAAGGWNVTSMKFVTGDFNGDGRDDIGALYGAADGHLTTYSFLASPTGGFQAPKASWTSSTWGTFVRAFPQAGDVNGDGLDDMAIWYDAADGHDALHTLTAKSDRSGGFNAPYEAWTIPPDNMYYPNMKVIAGDYNGDGKDEVAAMYGYADGSVGMLSWTAKPDASGTFTGFTRGWSTTPGNWYVSNVSLLGTHS